MSTAAYIRAYINRLPSGQIFSTREVLHFGSRASVDQSMYRLVNDAQIFRLAWGLFVKLEYGMKIPSIREIAEAKAKAFSKEIYDHGLDTAHALGIAKKPNNRTTFYVPGSATSSFMSLPQGQRVFFKATAARRVFEQNSRIGKVIRALWQLGGDNLNGSVLRKATINLNRDEIRALRHAAFRVPYWLARFTNYAISPQGQIIT